MYSAGESMEGRFLCGRLSENGTKSIWIMQFLNKNDQLTSQILTCLLDIDRKQVDPP